MSEYEVETYEHAGEKVRIWYDEYAGNPYTEWDQASELLIGPRLARDYNLGETWEGLENCSSVAQAARYLTMFGGYVLAIPFRFDDYGSSGARTYLVDEWSDRCAGFLVLTQEAYEREFAGMPLTGDAEHTAEKTCRAEFGAFRAWVEQEVYGWTAGTGEDADSVGGYYGELEYVKQEANERAEEIAHEKWINQEPPADVAEVLAGMRGGR